MSRTVRTRTLKTDRKKQRDIRVAELSINLVPEAERRYSRAGRQAVLAAELREAICLCMQNRLFMPTLGLLRSLIDTCALGIWLLKYAKDEEIADSVAHLSTPEIVKNCFAGTDQSMFEFIFEQLRGTKNELYRDVLHLSIHGDALHVGMRLRDQKSKKTWVHECVIRTNVVYVYFLSQMAANIPPAELKDYIAPVKVESIKRMGAMFKEPEWRGMADPLSE